MYIYHNILNCIIYITPQLDVWWAYPNGAKPETPPSRFPFETLENIVMTPHFSGWTAEQVSLPMI